MKYRINQNTNSSQSIMGMLRRIPLVVVSAFALTAGMVSGFASQASAACAPSGPFVYISTIVPQRAVSIPNYTPDYCSWNGYTRQVVRPGGTSIRGAAGFQVRDGERVGYTSLATGAHYISHCGTGNGYDYEYIGNSVSLDNYIHC